MRLTLKAARVNSGLEQKEAAEKLGISEQTFTRSMKKRAFGTDEASKIVTLLSIDDPEAVFFSH